MKPIAFLTKRNSITSFLWIIVLFIFGSDSAFSQGFYVVSVSPSFNEISKDESAEIIVKFNIPVEPASLTTISFTVRGERSAYHIGQFNFSNENKTVSFASEGIFNAGERVSVSLSKNILSAAGDSLKGFSWTFRIPSGSKPLNFSEPVSYGGGGYGMQCIDMNNDGYPDVVTSSGIIWINDGNGEFAANWELSDADGFYPIIADDFNRDGFMDLLYNIETGDLALGLGNGAGNFIKTYYAWFFIDYISTDLNSDGYPDIVGMESISINPPYGDTTSYWAVSFNDGAGHFNDTVWAGKLTGWFQKITSSDIDNDGDEDILIISHPAVTPGPTINGLDGLAVFRNNGEGGFSEYQIYPANIYLSIYFPKFLYPSDFNGDGFADIGIIGDSGGAITLNRGNGSFGDGTDSTLIREIWGPENAAPMTGGDLNGDNWIDLAVSGFGIPFDPAPKTYGILLNYGSYFPVINLVDTLGVLIFGNAAADLNNNGYLDLVHSGYGVHITHGTDVMPSVDADPELPDRFTLYQNYPNPFNSQTAVSFNINEPGTVEISVYNILGEEVIILEKKEFLAGSYRIEWDGKDNKGAALPSGAYIIMANFSGAIHKESSFRIIKPLLLQ